MVDSLYNPESVQRRYVHGRIRCSIARAADEYSCFSFFTAFLQSFLDSSFFPVLSNVSMNMGRRSPLTVGVAHPCGNFGTTRLRFDGILLPILSLASAPVLGSTATRYCSSEKELE